MGIACPLALVFLVFLPFGVLALHKVNRRPTRQFTIRGMMLFIFLWAVCLSQISVLRSEGSPDQVSWQQDCTVLFAWIVLALFYGTIRQFSVLLIHSMGVLFVVYFLAIGSFLRGREVWRDIEVGLLLGMLAGSFLGLIFFSLMMLLTILRRPLSPPRKEDGRP
jgi:hypothetical protein